MLSQKQLPLYVKTERNPDDGTDQRSLDLSKQQIRKIPQIDLKYLSVQKINLSYNFFKTLGSIRITNNQSSQSSGKKFRFKWLDVSFNILQDIDLKKQQNSPIFKQLQYLNSCTNKIQAVNINEKIYCNLKQLHLKNNKIKFFTHCPSKLQVLTLDKNALTQLAFTGGHSLQVLSASHNRIQKLAIKPAQLRLLDMQDNQVLNMDLFYEFLQSTTKIMSLNMLQNPININSDYRIIVLSTCPKIVQIDEIYINPHVRQGFRILKEEQKLQQVLQRTAQNYEKRLQAQLQYKEVMLEKLRLQQKEIQQKFVSYCNEEKEQMEILEHHAKNTLGKQKFKVAAQKDEFVQKITNMNNGQMNENNKGPIFLGQSNEKKKLNLDMEQLNHRSQYQKFQQLSSDKFKRNRMPGRQEINRAVDSIQQNSESENHDNEEDDPEQLQKIRLKQLNLRGNKKKASLNYPNSRSSIIKKGRIDGLVSEGKQKDKQAVSYKNLPQRSSSVPKQQLNQINNIKLQDVIDPRCIKYLQSYYSFYQ